MAELRKLLQDFSGGEIGFRMLLRSDLKVFEKSCMQMLNFMPTLQGTMLRAPGSRFMYDIRDVGDGTPANARIIPYLTPDNKYSLVELQPKDGPTLGDIKIIKTISSAANRASQDDPLTETLVYERRVPNGRINSLDHWDLEPSPWVSRFGVSFGWEFVNREYRCWGVLAEDPEDEPLGIINSMKNSFTVPEEVGRIILEIDIHYARNRAPLTKGGADTHVLIGTTKGGSEVDDIDLSFLDPNSARYIATPTVSAQGKLPGNVFAVGTTYYITFVFEAVQHDGFVDGAFNTASQPLFIVRRMDVLSTETTVVDTEGLNAVVPYTAAEIQDIHFVQSPYAAEKTGTVGKELVIVHANHPPMRLYLKGASYVFEEIFTNPSQHYEDFEWDTKGYPATCTSYLGRLILAGSNVDPVLGDPGGSNTETVWGTKVGDWDSFSDPAVLSVEILPEDSISFTTIYRSPIHWVIGHKDMLIGAESFEYTASADGIFQPSDLGVLMQSTHGSNRVQPVGMGQYILYPSDNGTRCRSMKYDAEDEGWVSPDMTILHPNFFNSGIVRMVRMRNPHQMVVCVTGNGIVGLLHIDSYENIHGWSRLDVEGFIKDVVVLVDDDGFDVLYLIVQRNIGGVERLYVEAIPDFIDDGRPWRYLQSYVTAVGDGTNVISGLDHLEGKNIQVMADRAYMGTFTVGLDVPPKPGDPPVTVAPGTVQLFDDLGDPVIYDTAYAGLVTSAHYGSHLTIAGNPGSKISYTDLGVLCIQSYAPIINGQRPADRNPSAPLDGAQRPQIILDTYVAAVDADQGNVITIEENIPNRIEVVAVYAKVTVNQL